MNDGCGDEVVYPSVEFSLEYEDDGSVLYDDPLLSSPHKFYEQPGTFHQTDPFASPFDSEFNGQFFSLLE